ncbi:MAG: FapA family protein [Actinobacteria bacterium]|nr:FapA family protein [Actinomycetota bacterium]
MQFDNKSYLFKIIMGRDKLTASIFALSNCDYIDKDEIYKELKNEGITFGVKDQEIDTFSMNPTREPVVIAEGNPPVPGKDGYMEVLFGKGPQGIPDNVEDAVDFRETSTIVSVEAEAQLVEVYPPVYGIEGMAVTGEVVSSPKPRVITLKAGKGVRIDEEGSRAFALVDGRPWIKDAGLTKVINCDPVYVHNSDVDIKTGNLRFTGDVKITGNVCEAMEVHVSGNVEIQGLVTMARIVSGGKLIVYGNVISSQLRAGIIFPGAKKLGFMFLDINTELQNLNTALDQLSKMNVIDFSVMDFGRVVLGLLDSRFKNIRPLIKNIQTFIGNKPSAEIPQEIVDAIGMLSCFTGLKQLNKEMFDNVLKEIGGALDLLNKNSEHSGGSILVKSALSCMIQSSGSVNVTGQGCVNTNITAGGSVSIRGSFKGGEILSEGHVDINELGSSLGAPPVVRVAAGSTVKIRKAYEGSIIQVGKRRVTLTREMDSFRARLNKDDQLEIY